MEQQNQQKQEKQNIGKFEEKYKSLLILYGDAMTRGLIAFIVSILLFSIFIEIFKLSTIISIVIVFMLMIILNPLYAKIKIGRTIVIKYLNWIDSLFQK